MLDGVMTAPIVGPSRISQFTRLLIFAMAAVAAALASVTLQGFIYGAGNNVFHIPIVLRWAENPAFANDQVVQSLRNFTSSVWLAIRLVANESNIEWVFYLAHVLTRAASLAALAWASASLGVRGLVPGILLMLWFGLAPGLRLETPIGAGDVFSYCFGHTDLAMPLTVVAITLAARRRYLPAFAMLGVIAHVNAFAANWAGWALMGVALGDKNLRETAVKSIGGLALAAVLALPVAVWIFTVMESEPVSAAEHERFLRQYFWAHSLLEGNPPERVALFGGIVLSGLIGFRLSANAGEAWFRAMIGLGAMVGLGMILPELVTSRVLLDLHLLRASGLIQVLAVLGLTAASVLALASSSAGERTGGLLALILLALPALQGVPLAGAVLLAARRVDWRLSIALSAPLIVVAWITRETWSTPILCTLEIVVTVAFIAFKGRLDSWNALTLRTSAAVAAAVAAGAAMYPHLVNYSNRSNHAKPEWMHARDAAEWVRKSTTPDGMFLVPLAGVSPFSVAMFESFAHRPIWVDWKRGGAVMWAPSYYAEWSRRMGEVGNLSSLSDRMAYACKNGIRYVLTGPEMSLSGTALPASPIYRNEHFQVFDARKWCSQ